MKILLVAVLLSAVTVLPAMAVDAAVQFAEGGLKAYRTYGVSEALRIWEYPRPSPGVQKKLEDLKKAFGPIDGYEIVAEQPAGEFYSVVYALVRMEHAPVFMRLVCYRSRAGWRVHEIDTRGQPFGFVPGFDVTGSRGIVEEKEAPDDSG